MLLVLIGSTACERSSAAMQPGSESEHQALGGATATVVDDSTAANLRTPEGIAGTVGIVARNYGQSVHYAECSGTLVARDRVLTRSWCVADFNEEIWAYEPADASEFGIYFSSAAFNNGLGAPHEVAEIVHFDNDIERSFAILRLTAPVPEEEVQNVAPVFTGDATELLGQPTYIAGIGPTCAACIPDHKRRIGEVTSPIHWGSPPGINDGFLWADSDPVVDAIAFRMDFGGPIFQWHPASNRFVLTGMNLRLITGEWEGPIWSITGWGINDGELVDNWSHIGPHLGPDDDADGIPDAFDNCAPARCETLAACANPSQEDTDGNGWGDACDPCYGGDWDAGGTNSNVDAEDALGATALSDACDPVPVLRLDAQEAPLVSNVGSQSPVGTGPESRWRFDANSWVGVGADSRTFEDNFAFRYCACAHPDSDSYVDEELCRGFGLCDAGVAAQGDGGSWIKINVHDGAGQFVDGTNGRSTPMRFTERVEGTTESFQWQWYGLVDAGLVPPDPVEIDSVPLDGTRGMVASAVLVGPDYRSVRDETFGGDLRASLSFQALPQMALTPDFDPGRFVAICTAPHCLPWVMPWDEWLWRIIDVPNWIVRPGVLNMDGDIRLLRADAAADVAGGISSWTTRILEGKAGPVAWVMASESGDRLRLAGVDARAALIPREALVEGFAMQPLGQEDAARPLLAVAGPDQLAIAAELASDPWDAIFNPPNGGPVRLEAGASASFSALERTIYLVGGAFAGDAWRYEFDTDTLAPLGTSDAPQHDILATAYDGRRQHLYALEQAGATAILHRLDVATASWKALWHVPFSGAMHHHGLLVLDDGRLMLTAADAAGWNAWIARVAADDLRFDGRYTSTEPLVDVPTMGMRHPVAAVQREGVLDYQDLPASLFKLQDPCEAL